MNSKKLFLLSAILLSAQAHADVSVPEWYHSVDNLLNQLQQVRSDINDQIAYNRVWGQNLAPWCAALEEQNKLRKDLHACIKNSFAQKDAEINSLNTTLNERKSTILALDVNISNLEGVISGLNNDLSNLEKEILRLQESFKTLLELDAEKANALLADIASLKNLFVEMETEREIFRGTLQSFYQCVNAYNYTARTDNAKLSSDLDCAAEND